ncbi:hypothetical protein AURDEDRAFT_116703 [Auricularia subglabra TFB-10046 SS5]|uniref:TOM13-domain-containing protein n=1 Tax=Auricularia subglabra (strain TFB-10046 / SS5) TaxID=717982 RepID=J0DB55_AURST|nr:hypothetical protein AURDEDRAFT_116703 [Auricularia subglabra TFB-10046 SS5]
MASSFQYSPDIAERKLEPTTTSQVPAQAGAQPSQPDGAAAASSDPVLSSSEPEWKEEYDERLAEWRAAAAVAREKAERERAKWEAIRAEEAKRMPSATSSFASGWESVGATTMASSTASLAANSTPHVEEGTTPSPADARDLTSNEHPGGRGGEVLQETLGSRPPAEQQHPIAPEHARDETPQTGTDEDSGKSRTWENIPSLASSFPSLPSRPTPPSMLEPSPPRHQPPAPAPARSITLVLFDPETSTRTRLLALAATLGINFFLPFVNGVMLGFGEITAKALVNWWRPGPKLSPTQLGLRAAPVV